MKNKSECISAAATVVKFMLHIEVEVQVEMLLCRNHYRVHLYLFNANLMIEGSAINRLGSEMTRGIGTLFRLPYQHPIDDLGFQVVHRSIQMGHGDIQCGDSRPFIGESRGRVKDFAVLNIVDKELPMVWTSFDDQPESLPFGVITFLCAHF